MSQFLMNNFDEPCYNQCSSCDQCTDRFPLRKDEKNKATDRADRQGINLRCCRLHSPLSVPSKYCPPAHVPSHRSTLQKRYPPPIQIDFQRILFIGLACSRPHNFIFIQRNSPKFNHLRSIVDDWFIDKQSGGAKPVWSDRTCPHPAPVGKHEFHCARIRIYFTTLN